MIEKNVPSQVSSLYQIARLSRNGWDLILRLPNCMDLFAEPLYSRADAPGIHCKDEETRAKGEKDIFPESDRI